MHSEMTNAAAADLRHMQGAWRALSANWNLSDGEVACLLPARGERASHPPRDTETRMRLIIAIGHRIGVAEDELEDWLRLGNPLLDWLSPLEAMSGGLGDLRAVRELADRGFLK